jgi:protein gp37
MSDRTRIAWADATWNPVVGCSPVGAGCVNCYARSMAQRLARIPATSALYRGVVIKNRWNGTVAIANEATWAKPLRWKKPRRIFVCSMGDLFHDAVPRGWIKSVSGIAVDCPQHTFLWLTKRGARMAEYTRDDPPPPNVWCGISASTQSEWDDACYQLAHVKAAVKWISLEPMIERVTPGASMTAAGVNWVVVGCESGPHRRPCDIEDIRHAVSRCQQERVPVYVKQIQVAGKVSDCMTCFPDGLRVREWPR